MLRENILEILMQTWPSVIITSVILITFRMAYIIKNKKEFILYRELLGLLFVIYILFLFYVVTFEDASRDSLNLIPFKEIFRYEIGSNLFIKNVLGNMIMFFPLGFFAGYYIKTTSRPLALFLTTITSVSIELTQTFIGRIFDIDDIILNVLGGMLGFYFYIIAEDIRDHSPAILKKSWFYNIIIIILLVGVILYLLQIISIGV